MKRIVLFFMTTVTVVVLLFGYRTSTSSKAIAGSEFSVGVPVQAGSTSGSVGTLTATAAPATGSAAESTAPSSGPVGAGTVTGTAADTRWGPVQVQLTVANGKITDVAVVEYPNNNHRDQEINAEALPILVQETLSAQSAQIDMVSGATVTSDGYLTSLQSALDQAGLA